MFLRRDAVDAHVDAQPVAVLAGPQFSWIRSGGMVTLELASAAMAWWDGVSRQSGASGSGCGRKVNLLMYFSFPVFW